MGVRGEGEAWRRVERWEGGKRRRWEGGTRGRKEDVEKAEVDDKAATTYTRTTRTLLATIAFSSGWGGVVSLVWRFVLSKWREQGKEGADFHCSSPRCINDSHHSPLHSQHYIPSTLRRFLRLVPLAAATLSHYLPSLSSSFKAMDSLDVDLTFARPAPSPSKGVRSIILPAKPQEVSAVNPVSPEKVRIEWLK